MSRNSIFCTRFSLAYKVVKFFKCFLEYTVSIRQLGFVFFSLDNSYITLRQDFNVFLLVEFPRFFFLSQMFSHTELCHCTVVVVGGGLQYCDGGGGEGGGLHKVTTDVCCHN